MKPTYAWHIIKKTTSAILRPPQPIITAFSTSPPPQLFYHTPPHSASQPASTSLELNNKLVDLARQAQYDEAHRLYRHLLENKIQIKHHVIYEKLALTGVDLGSGTVQGLKKFTLWFWLVPARYELPPKVLTNQGRYIYFDTRFSLLRCGNPRAYLNYIMIFGNIMATKGYTSVSFLEIARVVVMFAKKEVTFDYFKKLEEATAYYYWEMGLGGGDFWVLKWFWEVVVKLYLEKGWLNLAFLVVVEKNGKFELSDKLLEVLLKKLEASGDVEKASVIRGLLAAKKKKVSTSR